MRFTKQLNSTEVVSQLKSGMTIGIGGWGPRRKPMALVREILRSDLTDLTVVCYGGPEVGMLAAAGKLKKAVYGFVSLDAIPIEPFFKKAREAGGLEVSELDEGLLQWGLKAAAMRLPFLPTRVGLGTYVMRYNPQFKTIQSPYADGELLLAMPAINLDVALLHVDVADVRGNSQILGPDPYFDEHFARAANACYISCEVLHERLDHASPEAAKSNYFERSLVTGVVHAPLGAHPTSCAPQYGWDMAHLKQYGECAVKENGFSEYLNNNGINQGEAAYIAANGGAERILKLKLPVF